LLLLKKRKKRQQKERKKLVFPGGKGLEVLGGGGGRVRDGRKKLNLKREGLFRREKTLASRAPGSRYPIPRGGLEMKKGNAPKPVRVGSQKKKRENCVSFFPQRLFLHPSHKGEQ